MADMYGRLTRRAGVCLGTLGPGATNLTTARRRRAARPLAAGRADRPGGPRADAQGVPPAHRRRLDVQADHEVERAAELGARHPRGGPQGVQGRAGAEAGADAHRAARGRHGELGRRRAAARAGRGSGGPSPPRASCSRRPRSSARRSNPIVLAGNGVARAGAASALREFARSTGIGVAETFMGKGSLDFHDEHALGTVGLQSRDYALAGFEDADVVITVGYDLVEHAPKNWNPDRDKAIVCIDTVAGRGRRALHDRDRPRRRHLPHPLPAGRGAARPSRGASARSRLDDIVLGRFEAGRDDDAFPMQPPRALWEIRQALGPRRHADLRRRPAQAVDRAHVPRPRARDGVHRQRPRRDGDRAADRDRGQARPPASARSSPSTATAAS